LKDIAHRLKLNNMATTYKIHPAIGIARVGNSPNDFFIGPELVGQELQPQGGFKDNQCRVKRQAVRFRIYAHYDNGTVQEITNAEAAITWTVHLVNKKAANPGRGNTESAVDLTIDPGVRTLNGPNQQQLFDTGTIKFSSAPVTKVPLGEIRSDNQNHLLVLGGFGKSASPAGTALDGYFWASDDWYDDVSDGPVTATIRLNSDNSTPAVVGAWVIVAPPKFAPHQDSVITLYDRVLQAMIDGGLVGAPANTSYTKDVYPILQRARDTGWVDRTYGSHTWPDPVTDNNIKNILFSKLKAPGGGGGNMPKINDSGTNDDRLTTTQYNHMQNWKNNVNFINDWVGIPPAQAAITPDGLDRAALEACVGGAFFPGIETGGLSGSRPVIDPANYSEPFRFNQAVVSPGDLTYVMALPWQNDFYQCADNWWPVPRPNYVVRQGATDQSFISGVVGSGQDMVDKWHKLGFILRNGSQHSEFDRCDVASIQLMTPSLNFQDVPQGPMGMVRETALAITFEVISPGGAVTLQYAPGGAPAHAQLVAFNTSVTVGPTAGSGIAIARLWVIYRTGTVGSVLPQQTVTVQDSTAAQTWNIIINGNTVARKTAAAALVLDRSFSMTQDRGDGQSKHVSLQQAAGIFVDVMLEGDGAGIVRFNQDAQVLQPILPLGDGGLSDLNRVAAKNVIDGNGLDPAGDTSIGDGIFEGRGILNSAGSFDVKSLVVLTDGMENEPRYIADVSPQINEYTYAIGLGQPQNISVAALETISGNNGGYLLVTGAIGTDNRFMLQKYFLQILAGISNAEIVLDPNGQLVSGRVERIPFQLTDADAGVDVILLTPNTQIIDFRVQTPSGQIIEPWFARTQPGMRFILSNGVSYYRLALPVEYMPGRFDAGGTWYALLKIGRPHVERSDTRSGADISIRRATSIVANSTIERGFLGQRASILAAAQGSESFTSNAFVSTGGTHRVPYSVVVHAYSNISLRASAIQTSFVPGALINIHASLAQSGIPLSKRGSVFAEITRPDKIVQTTVLAETGDGQFSGIFQTTFHGVYQLRIRATGYTQSGQPFTRERTLTAAVWRGGDSPSDPSGGGKTGISQTILCDLLKCLLKNNGVFTSEFEKRLKDLGINIDHTRRCLSKLCHE
jgi:L-lysine epsilon oxidase-like protein